MTQQKKDAPTTELTVTDTNIEAGDIKVDDNKLTLSIGLYFPIGANEEIDRLDLRRPIFNDDITAEKTSDPDPMSLMIAKTAFITGLMQEDVEDLDLIEDIPLLQAGFEKLRLHPEFTDFDSNENITLATNRRSVQIKLDFPIVFKDETYDELTMKRPKLRHGRDSEKSSQYTSEQNAHQYAHLCDVPIGVIKLIDAIDDAVSLDQAYGMFRSAKTNRRKKR